MKRLLLASLALLAAHAAQAQTTLRFGMNLPQGDSADYKAATAFKDYVEFSSGGRLKVQLFPGGQLGSERQMTEQVRDGALVRATAATALPRAITRQARDLALRASDWTQLPDAPLTEPQRTAWRAYRQQLRDLPTSATTWPVAP